jgi:hypothetical protein
MTKDVLFMIHEQHIFLNNYYAGLGGYIIVHYI